MKITGSNRVQRLLQDTFDSRTRYHLILLALKTLQVPEEQAGYRGSKSLAIVSEAFGE